MLGWCSLNNRDTSSGTRPRVSSSNQQSFSTLARRMNLTTTCPHTGMSTLSLDQMLKPWAFTKFKYRHSVNISYNFLILGWQQRGVMTITHLSKVQKQWSHSLKSYMFYLLSGPAPLCQFNKAKGSLANGLEGLILLFVLIHISTGGYRLRNLMRGHRHRTWGGLRLLFGGHFWLL